MKGLLALSIAVALVFSLVGCGDRSTVKTDSTETTKRQEVETTGEERMTQEAATTVLETEAPTTRPAELDLPTTNPPTTDPPETNPPHVHNYSATKTVDPECESDGYTVYECSCGSSYTNNYVSATGHSWGEWATTREPTSSAEGEKARTCSGCGATETVSIEKLPAEQIDTAALEEYGRQYGEANYDFVAQVGTRAGYYPGWTVYIDSMEEGRAEVAACIDATASQLIAAHGTTYCYLDVEVVHEGGNQYCVWVYYG